jgi:hypothetical protein
MQTNKPRKINMVFTSKNSCIVIYINANSDIMFSYQCELTTGLVHFTHVQLQTFDTGRPVRAFLLDLLTNVACLATH